MPQKALVRGIYLSLTVILLNALASHAAWAQEDWAEAVRLLGEAARIVDETNRARAEGREPSFDAQRFYEEQKAYQDRRYSDERPTHAQRPRYQQFSYERQPQPAMTQEQLVDQCHLRWSMVPEALRECLAKYETPNERQQRGRVAGFQPDPARRSAKEQPMYQRRAPVRSQEARTPECWEAGSKVGDHGGGIYGTGSSYEGAECAPATFR